ncbi:MAG: O-antigen ligase family protein [Deltaproteobacteria bacterium]|nr:O-antigen ligase family protein [Deltaproteobacteria bacterium]
MMNLLHAPLFPIYLLLVSLPFGPAVQNFIAGIVFALLLFRFVSLPKGERFSIPPTVMGATLAGLTYAAWLLISTLVNPLTHPSLAGKFTGILFWPLLPLLFAKTTPSLRTEQIRTLGKVLAVLSFLWGLVMISQSLSGWRVSGATFIFDEPRPRGFYSHPLTLAYTLVIFWPLAVNWIKRDRSHLWSWLFFLGICSGIILTQSRTVQIVAVFAGAYVFLKRSTWTFKVGTLAGLCLAGALLFSTDNALTRKYRDTFTEKGVDKHSNYADDRLAFWHVHMGMIGERPILGHGWGIDDDYRRPYYAKIGLINFIKPYPAHNTYLEILTEGGVVALLVFFVWLICFLAFFAQLSEPIRSIAFQTFACLFLAALTQNAFQDFEVRWALTLFCVGTILSARELRRQSALQ